MKLKNDFIFFFWFNSKDKDKVRKELKNIAVLEILLDIQ